MASQQQSLFSTQIAVSLTVPLKQLVCRSRPACLTSVTSPAGSAAMSSARLVHATTAWKRSGSHGSCIMTFARSVAWAIQGCCGQYATRPLSASWPDRICPSALWQKRQSMSMGSNAVGTLQTNQAKDTRLSVGSKRREQQRLARAHRPGNHDESLARSAEGHAAEHGRGGRQPGQRRVAGLNRRRCVRGREQRRRTRTRVQQVLQAREGRTRVTKQ